MSNLKCNVSDGAIFVLTFKEEANFLGHNFKLCLFLPGYTSNNFPFVFHRKK